MKPKPLEKWERELLADLYAHPENYPWEHTGTKGYKVKAVATQRTPPFRITVCDVMDPTYGAYIAQTHNLELEARKARGELGRALRNGTEEEEDKWLSH